ncbi:hypothetical protein KIN20_004237 [Parelaphostrongylus tenuis]|uniref:Uncharacterized protein n=1 Tax=Parelaphostrongylus tenuis TaxID=148309 RepID=A0AAD5MJN1_PARTN|nr:hypothetical protein KIN20_004237 [Parelaphostrongylus tenuis]
MICEKEDLFKRQMKIVGGYSLKRREQCVSLEHEETNGTLTYMEQRQLADDLELKINVSMKLGDLSL